MFNKKKPAAEEAAAVAARIEDASARINAAAVRVPELRDEDARLEREITHLIGTQMADGVDRRTDIASRRARRVAIATEIEELQAEAALLKRGLAAAAVRRIEADRKAAREEAAIARTEAAMLLDRAAVILQELWTLDGQIADAFTTEASACARDFALGQQLTPPDWAPAPDSGWRKADGTSRGDPLDPAFDALLSAGALRASSFDEAIRRIKALAATAAAANGVDRA